MSSRTSLVLQKLGLGKYLIFRPIEIEQKLFKEQYMFKGVNLQEYVDAVF